MRLHFISLLVMHNTARDSGWDAPTVTITSRACRKNDRSVRLVHWNISQPATILAQVVTTADALSGAIWILRIAGDVTLVAALEQEFDKLFEAYLRFAQCGRKYSRELVG